MSRPGRLVSAALLAVGLHAGLAQAETVAVLGIEPVGVGETAVTGLLDGLRSRLAGLPGVQVVPSKDFLELKFLFNCMDPKTLAECLGPAGRTLGVDRFVVGTLTARKGQRAQVSLRMIDGASGAVVHAVDEEVGAAELAAPDVVARWAAALTGRPLALAQARLEVASEPPGATVVLDGRAMGTTPITLSLPTAGRHELSVAKDGFHPQTLLVSVPAGERTQISARLISVEPLPIVPPAAPAPVPAAPTAPDAMKPVFPDEPPAVTPPAAPAPPSAAVAPPVAAPAAAPQSPRAGRIAEAVGALLLAFSLAAAGTSIYTWRHFTDLEVAAHGTLEIVQTRDLAYSSQNAAWFKSPSCRFPGPTRPLTNYSYLYEGQCGDGTSYANATTGLLVTSGILAVAGLATVIAGAIQSHRTEPRHAAFAPRLRALAPSLGPGGAALSATVEF